MRGLKRLVATVLCGVLTSCGGGGGGSSLYGGGSATPSVTASAITLDLGGVSSITNNGSDTVTATVTAKDANNVVMSGVAVTIAADLADVAMSSSTTDSAGKVTATISIGQNKANRVVRVTATSGALTQSRTFNVTGSKIKSTVVPSVLAPAATGQIQYQLVDVNGNPMADQQITVTASGLANASANTDSNGTYTFSYTAPSTPGDLVITANAAGATPQQDTITVQAASGGSKPAVTAGSILSASVEASPSVVTVNEVGSSSNRSAVRALFLGGSNQSIENVRVRFDLGSDPNSVGGSLASGSSIVYSNVNGEASTFYIPAAKASPTNGVTIRACYGYTDAELAGGACPNQATTTLTVASGAVSVTIGTNNKLIELNSGLLLAQDFVVTVNDSAGRAKSGVDIVPSVDLISFGKGKYIRGTNAAGDKVWGLAATQYFTDASDNDLPDGLGSGACWNEDRNRNSTIEAAEDSSSIAYSATQGGNGNGILDPAKSDVLVTVNGGTSARTDSTGVVTVRITYARNLAGWLKFNILVSAGGVSGTEGRANWIDVLGVPSADIKAEDEPAFVRSRYGVLAGCQNPN